MKEQSYLRQDKDHYDSSYSSTSGRTRDTWSSSNRGLIQIGSLKISATETDDTSMMDDSSHRFSVIIHDNTDINSLAAASSHQIEDLHGSDDPNVKKSKTRAVSKSSKMHFARSQNKRIEVEEDSFDHLCDTFEGFVCRPNDKVTVYSSAAPTKVKDASAVQSRDALDTVSEGVERTTSEQEAEKPTPVEKEPIAELAEADSRDALDKVFDGVEIMTCGPDNSHRVKPAAKKKSGSKKTNQSAGIVSSSPKPNCFDATCESIELFVCRNDTTEPQFSQERDFLDKLFDGIEGATCRSESTKKRENKKPASKSKGSSREPEVAKIIEISHSEDDELDFLCNGVEYTVCRSQAVAVKQTNARDLLDHIFDPSCDGFDDDDDSVNGNSLIASVQSGPCESFASDFAEREAPAAAKNDDGDFLDYFFEGVESRTCRPVDDELSQAPPPKTTGNALESTASNIPYKMKRASSDGYKEGEHKTVFGKLGSFNE